MAMVHSSVYLHNKRKVLAMFIDFHLFYDHLSGKSDLAC